MDVYWSRDDYVNLLILKRTNEMCDSLYNCDNENTPEPHSCPYEEDINENYDEVCTCCVECQGDCALEI